MYTKGMETIVFWTLLSLAVAIVALMVLLIIRARSVGPRHKRIGLSAEQLVSALDSMD